MLDFRYKIANPDDWQGRIDSSTNYDAFRWHQLVQSIDLRTENQKFTGKLGICFIGFCSDEGVRRNKGRIGASKGPSSIRKELSILPCWFKEDVKLFDAGNIHCEDGNLEESQKQLGKAVSMVMDLGLFPIILGGGHETAYGHYLGVLQNMSENIEKPKIGVINFDAHFDLRPYDEGASSGTMFRQIADNSREKGLDYMYFCLGLQKHSNTPELFNTADRLGVGYILAKDTINVDNYDIIEKIYDFIKPSDSVMVTICSDVFSTAFAPGVSASQPLGLDPERVIKYLKYILRTNKVASFDISEVSPRFDQDNTTANLAAVIIFSIVNTLSEIHSLAR